MSRSYGRWHREWDWGKRRISEGKPSTVGRWSASVDLSGMNRPRVVVGGEGEDWAYIAVGYGSPGADPVLHLEVDLEGTRLGRRVAWLCWRKRQVEWWLRHRHEAPEEPDAG